MFELFKSNMDGNMYASVDEYNEDVSRIAGMLEEELGKVERSLYDPSQEICDDLGVVIKEVENDSERGSD